MASLIRSKQVSLPKVALLIKTFMRTDLLFEVVDSIYSHAANVDYRIYVADDGDIDDHRETLYKRLEQDGHRVIRLPFDLGASAGRNIALRYMDEPYVLRLDDDFVFTEETRIDRMVQLLETEPAIGAVSDLEVQRHEGKGVAPGDISFGQGNLEQYGSTLWKIPAALDEVDWSEAGGIRYSRCDFARNFLLIRRDLLDHVRWDHRLKIRGEHIDFMLQIIRRSAWDLAYTPDSTHVHAGPPPGRQQKTYAGFRYRDADFRTILYEKWGISRIMVDRAGGSRWRRRLRSLISR